MMTRVLWSIIVIVMILSIPFLWERVSIESNHTTYEVSIPYDDIRAMEAVGIPADDVLSQFRSGGVESISFQPLTMDDLIERSIIEVVSRSYFHQATEGSSEELLEEHGILLEVLDKHHPYMELLSSSINRLYDGFAKVESISTENNEFLFLPYVNDEIMDLPITFDIENMERAINNDFSIILRLENNLASEEQYQALLQDVDRLKDYINHLLFIGGEVVGYSPNQESGEPTLHFIKEKMDYWDTNLIFIENTPQKGFSQLVQSTGQVPVRLHSLTLEKGNERDLSQVYRSLRAMKERNIQILYINLLNKYSGERYELPNEALHALDGTVEFLQTLDSKTMMSKGSVVPYPKFQLPVWMEVLLLLAASSFIGLIIQEVSKRYTLPIVIALWGVSTVFLLMELDFLMKLFVLGLAIIAPVYAVFTVGKPSTNTGVIISFVKGLGIALIGAWFVVSLLYGWEYMVGLEGFRGVKLLAVTPLFIIGVYTIGLAVLKKQVMVWHLIVLFFVTAIIGFYITRTGNSGMSLPFELETRQWLENFFGVRPRTTEFFIGTPLFLLGIYFVKEGYEWGKYFFLFGAITFSSIIGTFTHLHTPLLVSIQRTVIGLGLGVVIGVILIVSWLIISKTIPRERFYEWKL